MFLVSVVDVSAQEGEDARQRVPTEDAREIGTTGGMSRFAAPRVPTSERGGSERRREFRPGEVRELRDIPPSRLRERIEKLALPARERAVAWLGNIHFTEADFEAMRVDAEGGIYFADPVDPALRAANSEPASEPEPAVSMAAVAVNPFPAQLKLHSKPGAPNVLYLNFCGETVSNSAWNDEVDRTTIAAVAFSTDSDLTTFSDSEQAAIRRIWQRVAEDYAPFNIDVTTERPATFTTRTAHALITRSTDANGAENPAAFAGGVAYVGSFATFGFARYRPAWIYHDNLGGQESFVAEAASHEIGHNMGLTHDGKSDGTDYYSGHGSGETSWGPLMGTGYNRNVSQWSKGEYYLANNTQDDLATIAGKLSYRADDHGNSPGVATALKVGATGTITSTTPENDPANTNTFNKGVIERNADADVFSFATGGGSVAVSVKPWIVAGGSTRGGNVDLVIELYDANGQLLLENNGTSTTAAAIQTNLSAGIYYLQVKSAGAGNPTSLYPSGYSSYGSIGQYFISGSIVPSGVSIPPGAVLGVSDITESGATSKTFTVKYSDDAGIDVATIGKDDVRVSGPNGFGALATFESVDVLANGSPRVATYRIDAPSGSWTGADDGVYTVTMQTNAVGDIQGAFVAAGELGSFRVAMPRAIYTASMDTDPGWTMEGLWGYGLPNYSGNGPDNGSTGENIIAYNLRGNYENRLSPRYATTPPIFCAGVTDLMLRFQRWLRLRTGDTASIQISTNGTEWSEVWSTTRSTSDNGWELVEYSLPAWAASAALQIRWGMASGTIQNDIGWNIDDVALLGAGGVAIAPPTVALVSPQGGQGFLSSDVIQFTAEASDDGAVGKVEFFANDNLIGTRPAAPYAISATLAAGSYVITARATDDGGLTSTSAPVAISVGGPAPPPAITGIALKLGTMTLTVDTTNSGEHVLEASEDLRLWSPVATNTPGSGELTFSFDAEAPGEFFRLRVGE